MKSRRNQLHAKQKIVNTEVKGNEGEEKVAMVLSQLDPRDYRAFHNLIIPARNGTTQIDHVVASKFGIFVIETKHFSGTVFGLAADPYWHQVLGRSRYAFANPIHQNWRHTTAVMTQLELPETAFFPIVVFVSTSFGWVPPEGVMALFRLVPLIKRFRDPLFTPPELETVAAKLEALRNSGLTIHDHLHSLRLRLIWERVLAPYRHRLNDSALSRRQAGSHRGIESQRP